MNASKGREGALSIATVLIDDKDGYFGTKDASDEFKQEVKNILMNELNFTEEVAKAGKSFSYTSLLF